MGTGVGAVVEGGMGEGGNDQVGIVLMSFLGERG
jgi:hypothetical protein